MEEIHLIYRQYVQLDMYGKYVDIEKAILLLSSDHCPIAEPKCASDKGQNLINFKIFLYRVLHQI